MHGVMQVATAIHKVPMQGTYHHTVGRTMLNART